MDSSSELLALNAWTTVFFFNASGFFYADGTTCTWNTHCDFQCEVYNYDTRFLDFLGTWTVTVKRGETSSNLKVNAWGGNAIDAAGVFPVIMYMDYETGVYVGLDKLDPKSSEDSGTSYWYPDFVQGVPDFYQFEAGTIDSLGCPGTMAEWGAAGNIAPKNTY